MAGIKAGDHGTVLELAIRDNGEIVPLNGAAVDVIIINGDRRLVKESVPINDATNGICELTLTRTDLAETGAYLLQGIVKKQDGDEFASDIEKFTVGGRI